MQHSPDIWPKRPDINYDRELPELRPTVLVMHPSEDEFGLKFSSYSRLLRVIAWMRHFITKIRDSNVKLPDYLTVLELCSARAMLLVVSQKFTYGCERELLVKAKHLPDSHSLASLSPYLDSRGIMGIGGRLQKAGLGYTSTHPILLSIKSNRLKEIYNFINTSNLKECVTNWAAPKEIRWSFLPSRAPHFGGLWEAAVKSMKLLLQKTLGGCKLRFDEMTTVLTEVEALLNSRPLVPLYSVATDGIAPLTPGHFLIGAPLAALPSLPDQTSYTSLRRWNLVQHLTD